MMTERQQAHEIDIHAFGALAAEPGVMAAVDRIFFAASKRREFASEDERARFRERWLGRYLGAELRHGFLAAAWRERQSAPVVAGYLVGCLDNPAGDTRFTDITYYDDFASLCIDFPAHLHINLDETYRNNGIGARLIEAFAAHAFAGGAGGMHVVTSPGSPNVRFYKRLGFEDLARASRSGSDVVFLARRLSDAPG